MKTYPWGYPDILIFADIKPIKGDELVMNQ